MGSLTLSKSSIILGGGLYLVRIEVDCLSETDHMRVIQARNHSQTRKAFFNDDEITLDSHLEWFTAYLKNPYDIIFSIYYDNTYAGQISIYNINVKSKHAEIGRLFLIPNKRGNGIMNIVLKFILDDLRDGGEFNYVYLYSKVASFSAIKLYEKCGFDVLAGPTSETYPDLTSQTAVKMVMRL